MFIGKNVTRNEAFVSLLQYRINILVSLLENDKVFKHATHKIFSTALIESEL
ncbi:MAG: hypothetical protein ACI8R9_001971 [Paraglaciecola sp.]|jgi:hypothetical protein